MSSRALDPVLSCTRAQLCFAAWQRAQGRSDLSQVGPAWSAFEDWWDGRDLSYFMNLRQLARAAWNASNGDFESEITTDDDRARFDGWWSTVLENSRLSSSHRPQRSVGLQ